MYGPPRTWGRESPRRFGPPGRFPRRRSRSPIPPSEEGYPFPEPLPGPPYRGQPLPPYRGPRAEPVYPPRSKPDGFGSFDGRPPFREPDGNGFYDEPRGDRRAYDRGSFERRPNERNSPRFEKRPPVNDRPDFRPPRYPVPESNDYYPRDARRRDYTSPRRDIEPLNEPRGYPPREYPAFPPKDFGPPDPRSAPRRRSPEPRYNYREAEKPYPPRGSWYRGPSPGRW